MDVGTGSIQKVMAQQSTKIFKNTGVTVIITIQGLLDVSCDYQNQFFDGKRRDYGDTVLVQFLA